MNGLAFDQFYNNTVLTTRAEVYDCGSLKGFPVANASNMRDNRILYVGTNFSNGQQRAEGSAAAGTGAVVDGAVVEQGELPFIQDGCAKNLSGAGGFSEWQALGFDKGSSLTAFGGDTGEMLKMITTSLPL